MLLQNVKSSPIYTKICDPGIIYKTTNVECGTAPHYSANASCWLKALNWNKAIANMDVDLIGHLKNISVSGFIYSVAIIKILSLRKLRLQVFKRDYTNKLQPFLIDVHFNICDIILKRNHFPYGKMIWGMLKSSSNFNHSCPYSGHLFARGFYINEKVIPVVLPLGLYKFSVEIFENFEEKPMEYVGMVAIYSQAMFPVKSKRNSYRTN
ncbi:hypothetical protein KR018_009902 [Drosophila ironensis]|nr:hypothetical protein KR018_009902 [Drosophila ironensis]